ncbi:probable glycosyltransferase At5g25310 [Amborella trichopoda]|uniref:probable glycosyltransferase At5g25310 n=1 Tax=Amborella trichopoda TaxID=13333 RepID=UPI0009C132A0|nr:probable glycosyltransferase At5g25310 [Amborella trichopoda]|eukprot:XP_020530561.1 probable glycosyltransferase At5g25310 [Amborella trichopoda]
MESLCKLSLGLPLFLLFAYVTWALLSVPPQTLSSWKFNRRALTLHQVAALRYEKPTLKPTLNPPQTPKPIKPVVRSHAQVIEAGLARARKAIKDAASNPNSSLINDPLFSPDPQIFRNPAAFHRSYLEMENRLKIFVYKEDYVSLISSRHPFWNASLGADHFFLSCHDWAPHVSRSNHNLYNTSIRVLCNANTSEGFNPSKDISLPEINLRTGELPAQLLTPADPRHPRPILAFFAGGLHGPIRPLLLQQWQSKDPDIKVYQYLPKGLNYYDLMSKSKYCLCPSGYEVASPRVVEAIHSGCVPVLISNSYVLPFSDVLRWEAFTVSLSLSEIPRVKEILEGIPEGEYQRLRENLGRVRRHFVLNQPAQRLDVFHMVMHSLWLRRLNLRMP